MVQFLSHRLTALTSVVAIALVAWLAQGAIAPLAGHCQAVGCQCWYCDHPLVNGVCPDTQDGGCIGCLGSCTSENSCLWAGQAGGCGPISCGCRDSDCQAQEEPTSTPPLPTPTPTPPAGCPPPGEVRTFEFLTPPTISEIPYRPNYPVVVGQDPQRTGFELHLVFTGGRYEYKTQELEQWCGPDGAGMTQGRYPDDCPDGEWHWECPWRCAECYDDPLAAGQVRMRLADSAVQWIQGELASRYTGARLQEGLPRIWQLPDVWGRMTYDTWWRYAPGYPDRYSTGPVDPGVHGGKVVVWTTGTPRSGPQVVERAFAVPVYLKDTTETELQ